MQAMIILLQTNGIVYTAILAVYMISPYAEICAETSINSYQFLRGKFPNNDIRRNERRFPCIEAKISAHFNSELPKTF